MFLDQISATTQSNHLVYPSAALFTIRMLESMDFLICILLAATAVVRGEQGKDPRLFVRNFDFGIGEIEPFIDTQLLLEKFAERVNLYRLPEGQRRYDIRKLLENPGVQDTIQQCKRFSNEPKCDSSSKYRSANGTCNNLKRPLWGSAVTKQDRLMPAFYDGQKEFRKSVTGQNLPAPRMISLRTSTRSNKSPLVSALFTFFGQLIVHDIVLTPSITINGTVPNCCTPQLKGNEACRPIILPRDDPFFSQFGVHCRNFVRKAPTPTCDFEKRSPLNAVTAFIDVSTTYSSDDQMSSSLREHDGSGRLKTQKSLFGELMPKNYNEETSFCLFNEMEKCFLSGDERGNQHTMIANILTIYLRLHNKYADRLRIMNHHWNDEKIYQEVRRIVGAIQQYIVYEEYLPLLLSEDYMEHYRLKVDIDKGSLYYDTVRPITLVEFGAAAFRLHSMIPSQISTFNPQIRMATSFSYTDPLFKGEVTSFITGSSEAWSEQNDPAAVTDITEFLYKPPGADYSFDLVSTNVQRGRDLGLPPYVDMVKECSDGKIQIRRFSDLNQLMNRDSVEFLRSIYKNVEDIDLWIGLINERTITGTVAGPTASCIIAIQFYRFKYGDSFYFTHTNGRYPFSKEQLQSLQTVSLAKIICESLSISKVRRYPLRAPGENNPIVLCEKLPSLDLKYWKENLNNIKEF